MCVCVFLSIAVLTQFGGTSLTLAYMVMLGIVTGLAAACFAIPCVKRVGEVPFGLYRVLGTQSI